MRFKASASNVDVDVLNAMDVVGLFGLMPALKDKIDEMQSQLGGR